MKQTRTIWMPLALIAGALLLAAALAACGLGSDPQATPTADQAAALQMTAEGTPSPHQITPLPTPLPFNPQFGPITGADYTPEPLHTPLPASVSEQPCRVRVEAPQVTLHSEPNAAAPAVGTAFEREKLVVDQITRSEGNTRWVHTAPGWLPLEQEGRPVAQLVQVRACEILLGNTPDTTLLGLHVLNERSSAEVLDFVRRMKEAGKPVGTMKGLNGTEAMLNEIEQISPETVTVYRSLITERGLTNCPVEPGETPDPVTTARDWYATFGPQWDAVNADYFEYMNECPAPLDWIAAFSLEMMKLANQDERCLLLFSFPGGNPDMDVFNQLLPALEYAAENPCAPGRTHGIALHAYSTRDDMLASESDVWLVMRHRIVRERLQMVLPQAAQLPIYITEFGIGGGTLMPACETIIRDALQYIYQVEEDPYVKGIHLWSVGSGAQWYDITPCLPDLTDALLAYYN